MKQCFKYFFSFIIIHNLVIWVLDLWMIDYKLILLKVINFPIIIKFESKINDPPFFVNRFWNNLYGIQWN